MSILTGPAIGGDGYAVLGADGSTLANRVSFDSAEKVARSIALRPHDAGTLVLTFSTDERGELHLQRKPAQRNNKA